MHAPSLKKRQKETRFSIPVSHETLHFVDRELRSDILKEALLLLFVVVVLLLHGVESSYDRQTPFSVTKRRKAVCASNIHIERPMQRCSGGAQGKILATTCHSMFF